MNRIKNIEKKNNELKNLINLHYKKVAELECDKEDEKPHLSDKYKTYDDEIQYNCNLMDKYNEQISINRRKIGELARLEYFKERLSECYKNLSNPYRYGFEITKESMKEQIKDYKQIISKIEKNCI